MNTPTASFKSLSCLTAAALFATVGLARSGILPDAPSDLQAGSDASGQVVLSWRDNSSNEVGFKVVRDPAFAEGAVMVPSDTTSFLDQAGKGKFTYRISAVGESGESAALTSGTVNVGRGAPGPHGPAVKVEGSGTSVLDGGGHGGNGGGSGSGGTGGSTQIPTSPNALRAVAGSGAVNVRWNDRSNNELTFDGQRETSVDGASWTGTSPFTSQANVATYADAVSSGMYRYRVRATGAAGSSAYTSWVIVSVGSGTTTPAATPPTSPSGVSASDIGSGRAMVTWTDTSSNEDGFQIVREPAFSSGVISVGANTAAYVDQSGNGTFIYRVRAFNATGNSDYIASSACIVTSGTTGTSGGTTGGGTTSGGTTGGTNSGGTTGGGGTTPEPTASGGTGTCPGGVTNGAVGEDGWTVLTPSPDTRVIYVSSSLGSDANSGTTETSPKRTIAAAYALLRDGFPDWLALRSGDEWHESFPFWTKSGRSQTERMVVTSYGSGERPFVKTGVAGGFSGISPVGVHRGYLAITDIHFLADTYAGGSENPAAMTFLNAWRDLLIENVLIERFTSGIVLGQCDPNERPSNIQIRRCVVADSYSTGVNHPQGIIAGETDVLLIEECVVDHNGWLESVSGAVPTMFRHNLYLSQGCTNVVTRGNIVARAGSTGISQRGGGVSENNLCLQNPLNLDFGHGQMAATGQTAGGLIRNNVVLDSRNIDSANPRGSGIGACYAKDLEISANIIAQQRSGTANVCALEISGTYENLTIKNNVVVNWTEPGFQYAGALKFTGTPRGPVIVRDNIFQQGLAGTQPGSLLYQEPGPQYFTYSGNKYWTPNTGSNVMTMGVTYAQWVSTSGETGSTFAEHTFADPRLDIAAYMTSLGRSGGLNEFMVEARKQSRANWRPEFSAPVVNTFFRQRYAVLAVP
jgi:hypothetical protein